MAFFVQNIAIPPVTLPGGQPNPAAQVFAAQLAQDLNAAAARNLTIQQILLAEGGMYLIFK